MVAPPLRVGIDIGGTFTDFVVYDPAKGTLQTFKLLSNPEDPAQVVLAGLQRIWQSTESTDISIVHGSTIATNALLERKGARASLITTRGFRDTLEIGRQNRPALYDLFYNPPPPLIPVERRLEVDERVDHDGNVLIELRAGEIDRILDEVIKLGVDSVAICLLFSFLHPEHERSIGKKIREKGILVSLSSEILPEFREYERMSTTAVNAYVSPILDEYLLKLENELPNQVNLRVMQSNGGSISFTEARRFGVRCILSGPAGGVIGCQYISDISRQTEAPTPNDQRLRVITFDMGGTSTDVSLIDEKPRLTTEAVVGGCPVRIPLLDIHTIGAGGGSIARKDQGGALRVGPESAGANPGPACYGRGGTRPTITDANLVLGRLQAEHFLGGNMPLYVDRANESLSQLGHELGLTPIQAALGVVQVANAHMERALRVISVERGYDPRDFSLLSFGGAGGLHAADLARNLGISRVLVPPLASTLSAFGMLAADVVKDYTQTVMLPGTTPIKELAARLEPLARRGKEEIRAEGIVESAIHLEPFLDIRYRGQSYELIVPFSDHIIIDFHSLHEHQYGYAKSAGDIEIVNLRLRAVGKVTPPPFLDRPKGSADAQVALIGAWPVVFEQGNLETLLYDANRLQPGNRMNGPAVIVRQDTTILVGPKDIVNVDPFDNLVIEVAQ